MAERCGCAHTLGQHAYGDDLAPCDLCPCRDFHAPEACRFRAERGDDRCANHWLWHGDTNGPGDISQMDRPASAETDY